MGHISLLLGAGFSVNYGYPTAKALNSKITSLQKDEFCISGEGDFIPLEKGEQDPFEHDGYAVQKHFLVDFIQFYCAKKDFNYEEFYDYYKGLMDGISQEADFDSFCDQFRQEYQDDTDNHNLLYRHNSIFNQLIKASIVDGQGNVYYQPVHHGKPSFTGYTGFLNCLELWGADNTVHVHTLNHDLLFEVFKSSDWLQGELSDGFEELGSPFYGKYQEQYMVRLPRFVNEYSKKFRLYKLHGSVDQYPFHTQQNGVEDFIKTKYGLGQYFNKEVRDEQGQLRYIKDWINYSADFLSGTTSKIQRYREAPYYKAVFERFEENLSASELLVVIGYGGLDSEINELIQKHFTSGGSIYLVEPYPGDGTRDFCARFGAIPIKKTPNELEASDFF